MSGLSVNLYLVESTEHYYEAQTMFVEGLNWFNITSFSSDLRVVQPELTVIWVKQDVNLVSIKSTFIAISLATLNNLKSLMKLATVSYTK